MLDGREALREIDRAIDEARREAEMLKASLVELSGREDELRSGVRNALGELARFRLDQSRAGEVAASVAGIDRNVENLMKSREEEYEALKHELAAISGRIDDLENRRDNAASEAERAAEALDSSEATLQQSLEKDPDYQQQFDVAENAERVAAEAENKRVLAEEDRRVKGEPYEADPLFMYLWSCGYGTPSYKGSGIIRMGDHWVARLIRFEDARRNYFTLTEIPMRLGEHAARMRARADAEIDALAALESAAREQTDIPERERALSKAQAASEEIDQQIAAAREQARSLEASRSAFERGEDPKYRAAVEAMYEALEDDSVAELRRAARETRMPEDDRIVERLVALEDELDDVSREGDELRRHARLKSDRLIELEDMRVEFRRRRYDDYGSQFSDGGLFALILAEFVRGAMSGGEYWDRLGRSHRRRATHSKPDFGSGRFRFPGPLSFPGSSRSRGGGFRTGGFKTGGGF